MLLLLRPGGILWTVLLIVLMQAGIGAIAQANMINFDTGTGSNWTVTGGGAVNAPAFYLALPEITLTSNSFNSGTFATGGTVAQFNGAWYADFQFTLPAGASSVSMSFTNLFADDRTVLQLNGVNLGDYFLNNSANNPPLTGSGVMRFPGEGSDQPYTFTGITSGTVTTGFVTGMNDIRLVVNNTDINSLNASTVTFQNSGDSTYAGVLGSVTYSAVPEPAPTLLLGSIGIVSLLGRRRRPAMNA